MPVGEGTCPEVEFICLEIGGVAPLPMVEGQTETVDDRERDVVLDAQNVGYGQVALEWLRPHRDLAVNLHEACIDAKAAIGPHRGNLEQVVDAQFASDLADTLWRPLEGK